jgi:adenosylmethionine-8-amino-7-oxononanoate aminotransferase
MKDYEQFPPIPIESAKGSFLYTTDGKPIIDAISSWWCKSLGHTHPRLIKAATLQMEKYEHIIAANTCNPTLVELSEKLATFFSGLDKVFYADNGSTAVEIAIKMSLQYHLQTGEPKRTTFLALKNGYHGETILTLAAGDCELYSIPYASLMPKIEKIQGVPYVSSETDDEWGKMSDAEWSKTEIQLEQYKDTLAGIIFEPIIQGAGGMLIYSQDFLKRLRQWSVKNGVHLIADEIMTGFGRTGKMFACEYAEVIPDFVALSKGLTAGFTPMSAVLCSTEVYNAFYDDYKTGKAFLHSNTFTASAFAAAVALEVQHIYDEEQTVKYVNQYAPMLRGEMEKIQKQTGALHNIRSLGFVVAADIINPKTGNPYPSKQRTGFQFYQTAVKNGALLRPLGDAIYFFPPLNMLPETIQEMGEIALNSLQETLQNKE